MGILAPRRQILIIYRAMDLGDETLGVHYTRCIKGFPSHTRPHFH